MAWAAGRYGRWDAGSKGRGRPQRVIILASSRQNMLDPRAHPTCLLRRVALCARWTFGLLLAASLLLALAWGALHGWIVPRIGEHRLFTEARASQARGVPVRLGSISA